jgi:hypothetical protein
VRSSRVVSASSRFDEGSAAKDFKVIEMRNNGPEARGLGDQATASVHRSVYLPLVRGVTPRSLEVFDFAEQGMVTGQRDTTTVPTQSLYMLNDPFIRRQALAFAERVLHHEELNDGDRINLAYRLAFSRPASSEELDQASQYIAGVEAATREEFAAARLAASTKTADRPASATSVENPTETNSTTQTPSPAVAANAQAAAANPDDIDPTDVPVKEETIEANDPKVAAWASFCQAILGTAEFRYLK